MKDAKIKVQTRHDAASYKQSTQQCAPAALHDEAAVAAMLSSTSNSFNIEPVDSGNATQVYQDPASGIRQGIASNPRLVGNYKSLNVPNGGSQNVTKLDQQHTTFQDTDKRRAVRGQIGALYQTALSSQNIRSNFLAMS